MGACWFPTLAVARRSERASSFVHPRARSGGAEGEREGSLATPASDSAASWDEDEGKYLQLVDRPSADWAGPSAASSAASSYWTFALLPAKNFPIQAVMLPAVTPLRKPYAPWGAISGTLTGTNPQLSKYPNLPASYHLWPQNRVRGTYISRLGSIYWLDMSKVIYFSPYATTAAEEPCMGFAGGGGARWQVLVGGAA